jgi:NTP pyrophosphatase (non-canonical NTP hydrolase)
MDLDQYQEVASNYAMFPSDTSLMYLTLGLCGESGEVAEKIKKYVRENGPLQNTYPTHYKEALIRELGDVLWYLANLAKVLNVPLNDVARKNIEKIQKRLENNTIKGEGDDR